MSQTASIYTEKRNSQLSAESLQTDMPTFERDQFKVLISALRLQIKDRSPDLLQRIAVTANSLKFFQALNEQHSEEFVVLCCKYMTYMFHKADSFICHQGDSTHCIYVILYGSVKVMTDNNQVGELVAGDHFGPTENFAGLIHFLSYQCKTACHIGVIETSDFKWILDKMLSEKVNSIIEVLHKLPVLQSLTRHYIQKLGNYFKPKRLRRGQFLYKESERAEDIFFIQDGEFRISKKISLQVKSDRDFPRKSSLLYKNHKSNTQLAILGKGEIIGEEDALSDSHRRSTSCQCISEVGNVLIISKENFTKYVLVTDEGKELFKSWNLSKQGSRQGVLEKAVKLQKINVGLIHIANDESPVEIPQNIATSNNYHRKSSSSKFPSTPKLSCMTPISSSNQELIGFNKPKTPSNYLGYKTLRSEKIRIKQKYKEGLRNIHMLKSKSSSSLASPLYLSPKQERIAVINIQNIEDQICIDEWEYKLKREMWTSQRKLKRVTKSDHNMFRMNPFYVH
ncbi:unnamed protein product [Blepharisma stoltei]|uniref:Cyclic nucleotide-binding domain-containing protein n=1 Tax=Blepharisma stoltei TaxID=1481888 RepID=A0AAU9JYV1_9CILI|nr:unnamed protein product [Blepharisma stoltei]